MRHDSATTSWRRFSDRLKGLRAKPIRNHLTQQHFEQIVPTSAQRDRDSVAGPLTQQAAQLAAWESEGGNTADPRPPASPR
jgi:hypothetical protein